MGAARVEVCQRMLTPAALSVAKGCERYEWGICHRMGWFPRLAARAAGLTSGAPLLGYAADLVAWRGWVRSLSLAARLGGGRTGQGLLGREGCGLYGARLGYPSCFR